MVLRHHCEDRIIYAMSVSSPAPGRLREPTNAANETSHFEQLVSAWLNGRYL